MRLAADDPRVERVVLVGLGENGVDDDADGSWRARRLRMIAAFDAGPDTDPDAEPDPGLDGFPVRKRIDGAPFAAILRARDVQPVEPVPPVPVRC